MNSFISAALAIALAYLVGSIPSAYILTRWKRGVDIRNFGSRNVGMLNAYRAVGFWWALVVLLLDSAKGFFATAVVKLLGAPDDTIYATSVAAVAGHNWPIFLGLRGGRGAATVFGVSMTIFPGLTSISLGISVFVGLAFHKAVPGIFAGFIALNVMTIATGQSLGMIALCLGLTALVGGTYFVGQRQFIMRALRTGRVKDILGIE